MEKKSDKGGINLLWNQTFTQLKADEVIQDYLKEHDSYQLLEFREWYLPIFTIKISYKMLIQQKQNIIEKYLLKIINVGHSEISTKEGIKEILHLDDVFIDRYLNLLEKNKLIRSISVDGLGTYKITDYGKKALSLGTIMATEESGELTYDLEPQFNKISIISKSEFEPLEERFRYYNDKKEQRMFPTKINNKEFIQLYEKINETSLERKNQKIEITEVQITDIRNKTNLPFLEMWVYDVVTEKIHCRVWDYENHIFQKEIEDFLIEKEAVKRKKDYKDKNPIKNIELKKLFETESSVQNNKKSKEEDSNKSDLKVLRGIEIRNSFLQVFDDAERKVLMISPWISEHVVDEYLLERFKKAASRGVKLFIGWGIAKTIEQETRKPSMDLIQKIESMKDPEGNQAVFVHWIGNHHNKEIVVDDKYHMLGSYNWLSYRGDYQLRNESVYKVFKPSVVNQATIDIENFFINAITNQLKDEKKHKKILRLITELLLLTDNIEILRNTLQKVVNPFILQKNSDLLMKISKLLIYQKREDLISEKLKEYLEKEMKISVI
ncbi:phospholipase D-like domain-containing protein [Bacillus smithii]|uniref:phospholipase D-like domain-containing protein n=1 Tax=Bacillus smithii TaxID=1479 RepID=UPI0030C908B6